MSRTQEHAWERDAARISAKDLYRAGSISREEYERQITAAWSEWVRRRPRHPMRERR